MDLDTSTEIQSCCQFTSAHCFWFIFHYHWLLICDVTNFLCLCQGFSQTYQKILEKTRTTFTAWSAFSTWLCPILHHYLDFWTRLSCLTHLRDRQELDSKQVEAFYLWNSHSSTAEEKQEKHSTGKLGVTGLNRWFNKKSLLRWHVLLCNGTPAACWAPEKTLLFLLT